MNILIIGDFHGKFPLKLKKKIKKEKFDIILSMGDFCGSEKLSEIIFKYYYGKNKKELKKLPKKVKDSYEEFSKKAVLNGVRVLKEIKKLKKPFYAVHGNWDPSPYAWDISRRENPRNKYEKNFIKEIKKNFEFIDFKIKDLGGFVLVGGTQSSYPGRVDKKSLKRFFKKRKEEDIKELKRTVRDMKEIYAFRQKRYIRAFTKARDLKKPLLFLTHNCPYNTKLDIIRDKKAHKLAKGKHYGSYLERLMINRFKPALVICGHIHENIGKDKIGKSLIVNVGAALDNKAGILSFNEKTKKFNIKFIK